jgi:hypothetical protein
MKKLYELIKMYEDDAYHYDDFNDKKIHEVLDKLNNSLSSLKEANTTLYAKQIEEFKNSLPEEDKNIINDFITYCKYYNK